jgi:hypothetical protein
MKRTVKYVTRERKVNGNKQRKKETGIIKEEAERERERKRNQKVEYKV